MPSRTEEQERYSPDNRLTLEQQAVMAARIMDREGVSERRAFQIIGETQAARQQILNERVAASGGQPWGQPGSAKNSPAAPSALPPVQAPYRDPRVMGMGQ